MISEIDRAYQDVGDKELDYFGKALFFEGKLGKGTIALKPDHIALLQITSKPLELSKLMLKIRLNHGELFVGEVEDPRIISTL